MPILVCGSLAFDTIMVFPDQFRKHILADQIHILNVAFVVPEMRREFGGTAGNIGYNLRLLGEDPIVMATVGLDFGPFAEHFKALGISLANVRTLEGQYTAQAFITTDIDDNQITAFHPGAMECSHHNRVSTVNGVQWAIVSPDGRQGMVEHARDLAAAKTPFIFDPGQALPRFSGEELLELMQGARALAVNDYEARIIEQKTGRNVEALARQLDAVVVTRGAEGSCVYTRGERIDIAAYPAARVVDPTGCGDAFRAGLMFGIEKGYDWLTIGRIGNLMGALKVEHPGTQNQRFDYDEFAEQFKQQFGYAL